MHVTLSRHFAPSTEYACRYIFAFDVAIAQYKLTPRPSKLADASKFLELAREIDLLFLGEESDIVKESERLYLQLKQGRVPP